MRKTILILLIGLFIIPFQGISQEKSDEVKQLQRKVEKLEQQVLKDSITKVTLKQAFDYKSEFTNFKTEINQENRNIKTLAWAIGGFTVGSLLLALYQFLIGFRKKVDDIIDKKIIELRPKIEEKIKGDYELKLKNEVSDLIRNIQADAEERIKKEAKQLNRQIEVYDKEFAELMQLQRKLNESKKQKKIEVFVENESRKAVLENFFLKADKFKIPKITLIKNFKEIESKTDIVIFDDTADEENEEHVNNLEKNLKKILEKETFDKKRFYLFYGKRRSKTAGETQYKPIVQAANSEITLLSRLDEIIDYMNLFAD